MLMMLVAAGLWITPWPADAYDARGGGVVDKAMSS